MVFQGGVIVKILEWLTCEHDQRLDILLSRFQTPFLLDGLGEIQSKLQFEDHVLQGAKAQALEWLVPGNIPKKQ